jgi:hypothetical protein
MDVNPLAGFEIAAETRGAATQPAVAGLVFFSIPGPPAQQDNLGVMAND